MDCKKAHNLSFLFKEGELTGSQLKIFENHISNCEECSDFVRELKDFENNLQFLQRLKPSFPDTEELTGNIISFVEDDIKRRNRNTFENFIGRLTSIVVLPNVRIVLTTSIILIVSFFLMQEYADLNRLSNLEQRVALKQYETLRINKYSNNNSILNKIESIFDFATGEKSWLEIPNNMILIKKETLFSLMKLSEGLNNNQKKVLASYLRSNLGEINWSDGLNEKEILAILENSAQIRKDVENFIL